MDRRSWCAGLIAGAMALAMVLVNMRATKDPSEVRYEGTGLPYASVYHHPTSRLHLMLNAGDGQAFAAQAMDPTMARPEVFLAGTQEAAYRWQRPALPYLTWALSMGDPGRVPVALFAVVVASIGALAAAAASLARRIGRSPWPAVAVVLLPGALACTYHGGPEPLAAVLGLAGLLSWMDGRTRRSAVLWVLAVLARETLVAVPIGVAIHEWRAGRRRAAILTAIIPTGAFGVWCAVVRLRLGSWPWAAGEGRLGLPLAGIVERAADWDQLELATVVLIGLVSAAALTVDRQRLIHTVAAVHVVLAVSMGALVWGRWQDFGRPVLPLCVLGLVLIAPRRGRAPDSSSPVPGHSSEPEAVGLQSPR